MKIYYSNMKSIKSDGADGFPKIGVLDSYYGLKSLTIPAFSDSFFLDSGAFSVSRQGGSIDLSAYTTFIKENISQLDVYVSLDDISDYKASIHNYKVMKHAGLNPLPCFHAGEPLWVLEEYARMTDYIGLGGTVSLSERERFNWWELLFRKYPDSRAIGFHGFGVQSVPALKRFPWRTVDATSVHMQARYGGIMTPWGWTKISTGAASKELKWASGMSIQSIRQFIESLGRDYELAATPVIEGTKERCAISIIFYESVARNAPVEFTPSRCASLGMV
jgi:hypothetical protein